MEGGTAPLTTHVGALTQFRHTHVLSAAAPHIHLPGVGGSCISNAPKCLALQEQPWALVCGAEPSEQREPGIFYEDCKALVGFGSPFCPSSPPPATSPSLPSARHPALASGPGAAHSWTVFLGCLEQPIPTAFLSLSCSSLYMNFKTFFLFFLLLPYSYTLPSLTHFCTSSFPILLRLGQRDAFPSLGHISGCHL